MKTSPNKYRLYLETDSPYKRPARILLFTLFLLPILFLVFQRFDIYMFSHVFIMIILPFFIWCYLESEPSNLNDIKTDLLKIIFISMIYFSYLLLFYFVVLRIFNPKQIINFLLIELIYIILLLMVMISVAVVLLVKRRNHHRLETLLGKT